MKNNNILKIALAQISPVWLDKLKTLHINSVVEERQNLDVAGHYSRPDVTKLSVNRERQSVLDIDNDKESVFPCASNTSIYSIVQFIVFK